MRERIQVDLGAIDGEPIGGMRATWKLVLVLKGGVGTQVEIMLEEV